MAGAYEEIASFRTEDAPMHPGGFALTDRALVLCSLSLGARVLDIGCGTGGTVARLIGLHGLQAFGVDPSSFLLEMGRRSGMPPVLVRASGEDLPFKAAVWDCVLAECSLSVAKSPDGVLRECSRLLKERGRLVISDLYVRNPTGIPEGHSLPSECCLKGALSREDLSAALHAAGFHILLWEDHSPALKHYAAELLLSCDSVEEFRTLFWRGDDGDDGEGFRRIFTLARPGYFLLVAEKHSEV
jgi:arsenite methyltransferase